MAFALLVCVLVCPSPPRTLQKRTPLHLACSRSQHTGRTASKLVDLKADVNAADSKVRGIECRRTSLIWQN
eukprot:2216498-Rhodomonas_salina.1